MRPLHSNESPSCPEEALGSCSFAMLECSGTISAHRNLHLSDSSDCGWDHRCAPPRPANFLYFSRDGVSPWPEWSPSPDLMIRPLWPPKVFAVRSMNGKIRFMCRFTRLNSKLHSITKIPYYGISNFGDFDIMGDEYIWCNLDREKPGCLKLGLFVEMRSKGGTAVAQRDFSDAYHMLISPGILQTLPLPALFSLTLRNTVGASAGLMPAFTQNANVVEIRAEIRVEANQNTALQELQQVLK
ncbi:hypothetical protein AAY473_011451, partial [Plecturocebus cupreus]